MDTKRSLKAQIRNLCTRLETITASRNEWKTRADHLGQHLSNAYDAHRETEARLHCYEQDQFTDSIPQINPEVIAQHQDTIDRFQPVIDAEDADENPERTAYAVARVSHAAAAITTHKALIDVHTTQDVWEKKLTEKFDALNETDTPTV